MKKLFISSLFIFFTTTTVLNASANTIREDDGKEKISSNVLQHFGYTFYRATDVTWTINKDYQKATFQMNGKTTFAMYDLSNNFLVATQLADIKDLPEKTQESIKKDYSEYKTSNILKVISRPSDFQSVDDTNAYWIDLTNNNEHIIAIAFPYADLNVVKKEKN